MEVFDLLDLLPKPFLLGSGIHLETLGGKITSCTADTAPALCCRATVQFVHVPSVLLACLLASCPTCACLVACPMVGGYHRRGILPFGASF
jgi:hypothetical protein